MLKKKIYRHNIVQQIICGDISQQNQRTEQILGALETTYLVEINKVQFIYGGHGTKKYTQKWMNVLLFDMNKYH